MPAPGNAARAPETRALIVSAIEPARGEGISPTPGPVIEAVRGAEMSLVAGKSGVCRKGGARRKRGGALLDSVVATRRAR